MNSKNLTHPGHSRFLTLVFGGGRGQFIFSEWLLCIRCYLYENHGILGEIVKNSEIVRNSERAKYSGGQLWQAEKLSNFRSPGTLGLCGLYLTQRFAQRGIGTGPFTARHTVWPGVSHPVGIIFLTPPATAWVSGDPQTYPFDEIKYRKRAKDSSEI